MTALLAALPIVLVVGAMTVLRWSATAAGLAGLASAIVVGFASFGLATPAAGGLGPAPLLGGALLEALFTTATILWIVFPALCLYELQSRSGAFEIIRNGMARVTNDRRLQALLVAWFFGLFMEGVAGFGTPVALAAPILVGLGFSPVKAVSLALIGHAAGVSFGAVGTPVLPLIAATGLSGPALAAPTALLHAGAAGVLVAALLFGAGSGWPRLRDWGMGMLAMVLFLVPFAALAALVGPELPTIGGAIIGGSLFVIVVQRIGRPRPSTGAGLPANEIVAAAVPYLVLLGLVLASRLVPMLREPLRAVSWEWQLLGTFTGTIEPLFHPGTLLLASFLVGGLLQRRSAGELAAAAGGAGRRLLPVAMALLSMLALSRVLVHGGMIEALAEAAARSGAAWPLLAPYVGVLGTFVTGSATASNILFAEFQQSAATALGLPIAPLQAAQNFGAAIGNIIAPHNIIAGAATVGLAGGREGAVMRATLLACLLYAAVGGLLTFAILGG